MNQKLVEMLAHRLVSLPMNCSKKTITRGVMQGRFSFYALVSIPAASLDYRFFLNDAFAKMQSGALAPEEESSFVDVVRPLCILLLKFPQYFTAESLKKALGIFNTIIPNEPVVPHLGLYSEFVGQYLSNLNQWTSLDPDYLDYYSSESCAIRQTGVMREFVDTLELYMQFLSEVGEAVG